MDRLRAFYEPIQAKFPDRKSTVRLLSGDDAMESTRSGSDSADRTP